MILYSIGSIIAWMGQIRFKRTSEIKVAILNHYENMIRRNSCSDFIFTVISSERYVAAQLTYPVVVPGQPIIY